MAAQAFFQSVAAEFVIDATVLNLAFPTAGEVAAIEPVVTAQCCIAHTFRALLVVELLMDNIVR